MANGEGFKSLAEQVAELEGNPLPEYDPENIEQYDSDDSSPGGKDDSLAREHYEAVGKSKLRKREIATLGPQYAGSRITRDTIEEEDDDSDDPFAKGRFDSNSDSDSEPENLGPATRRTATNSVKDAGSDSQEEDDEDMEERSDGSEAGAQSDSEDLESDDEDDDQSMDDATMDGPATDGADRAELRRIMGEEQKQVTAAINEAAKGDVAKGLAVQSQRQTFDTLLNTRMRLQKALISTNSLAPSGLPEDSKESLLEQEDAVRSAETAALSLWTALNELRNALSTTDNATRNGAPAKAVDLDDAASMWSTMSHHESLAVGQRKATLQKWSHKTRSIAPANASRSKFSSNHRETTLLDTLQSHITDPSRLARTRVPRSCAPVQASKGIEATSDVYDDADFYSTLLQELLSRRGAAMDFDPGTFSAMKRSSSTKVNKRDVDRKASRGRKLKYTVHEKLVSFMAPDARGSWGERRSRELFGGLFGQRLGLDEAEEEQEEGEESDGLDALEEGLRLFRS
ncbi:TRAUB-domain-containing protein [Eremomyces bilateralis CBS 781.70]|uniref:Protein BFR2 n=1 Tax=Eremomyces bilateralis CBS 781.70 TaxID=1392243 RepID=A0A6G1FVL9_9PEZI|nr:TRAUB-domain-containing protein [Eremomyces bilateralis CBS 781.70]KAF1809711.1 TRAUB-domain-containing protein [Eremomyces bilateralis CBS 781.70]